MSEFSKSRTVFINAFVALAAIVAATFAIWYFDKNIIVTMALAAAALILILIATVTGQTKKLIAEFTIEPYEDVMDFTDWDDESLESYTELVKYRLTQNYRRETGALRRAGAMLALDGVVLALVGSFMANLPNLPADAGVLLVCSVVLLFISAIFAVWSMYSYRFQVISIRDIYDQYHPGQGQTLRDLNISILRGLIRTQRMISSVARIRSSTYGFGSFLALGAMFFIALAFGLYIIA